MKEHRHYQDSDLMRRRIDAARVLRAYRFIRLYSPDPITRNIAASSMRAAAHMAARMGLDFDPQLTAAKIAVLARSA